MEKKEEEVKEEEADLLETEEAEKVSHIQTEKKIYVGVYFVDLSCNPVKRA